MSQSAAAQQNDSLSPEFVRISRLRIKNFRLLHDVELNMQETTTLLVGRNNSGKTTLVDLLFGFTKRKALNFSAADFSEVTYANFAEAYHLWAAGKHEESIEATPAISLEVFFEYSPKIEHFGPLAPFILSLREDSTSACLRYRWELDPQKAKRFYAAVNTAPDMTTQKPEQSSATPTGEHRRISTEEVMTALEKEFTSCFRQAISAVDPDDPTNIREISSQTAANLLQVDFVAAQRDIDDDKVKPKEPLTQVYRALYNDARKRPEGNEFSDVLEDLQEAIDNAEEAINEKTSDALKALTPQFRDFGYPNLSDPEMLIQTRLAQDLLFSNNSSIHYQGHSGITRPENYNGLGSRNLIWILLSITTFQRSFSQLRKGPAVHLIIIEEPEAHLHPQMQQAFIRSIERLPWRAPFTGTGIPWHPQLLVSTHSSHIANEADFSSIRYLKVRQAEIQNRSFKTEVRDLSTLSESRETKRFLQQYLKLTESDLYFADKAIFVEGTAERLLIPAFINLQNGTHPCEDDPLVSLRTQYYTLIEVGGAFAHKFRSLLDFIEIPTLVITDIDSVKRNNSSRYSACAVAEGTTTSNATLKAWLYAGEKDNVTRAEDAYPLSQLTSKEAAGKEISTYIRVAYQIPESEGNICARTFEDAFIMANPKHFSDEIPELAATPPDKTVLGDRLFSHVSNLDSKSKFAFEQIERLFEAKDSQGSDVLRLPRYITEGLTWLSQCNSGADPRNEGATGQ